MSEKELPTINEVIGKFLEKKGEERCPNCGSLIDAIIVGKQGIRCDFCKGSNHLDQMSLASKIDPEAVRVIDFINAASEGYKEVKDEEGNVIDSPALKIHLSSDIFDGDVEKFIKDYVSMFVVCKRSIAKLTMPDASTYKSKANLAIKKKDEK